MSSEFIDASPCPFCGETAKLVLAGIPEHDLHVKCSTCGTCGPRTKKENTARRLWEQRINPRALSIPDVFDEEHLIDTRLPGPQEVRLLP
jgi:endogenous inhibitor of DNA gyrase (YacG/DUF329 family)